MNTVGLFLAVGGNELVNLARTRDYMEAGVRPAVMDMVACCEPCPGLAGILGDEDYQLPHLDPAPWYDPRFPESADFAGLVVENVTLSGPLPERPFAQRVGPGATLGRARLAGRTMTVTGWLAGRTCCAVGYGLRWLQHALLPGCSDACDGDQACFLTCCPSLDDPAGALEVCTEDQMVEDTTRDSEQSEYQLADNYWRTTFNTGLIAGVEVIDRVGLAGQCGCTEVVRVEFTLGIGTPWLYGDPVPCITDAMAPACTEGPCFTPDQLEPCPSFEGCLDDPECPAPAAPPPIPNPVNPCICIPVDTRRVSCTVDAPAGGDWFDATTIVRVVAPGQPLRNLAIRMWANPLGLDADQMDDCLACSTAFVTYVPAGGELVLDGRTRRNTITCGNTTRDASPNLYTLAGSPFTPLDLGCEPAVIAVDFACGTPGDATVSIDIVPRALW